jgi:hypothetical protein
MRERADRDVVIFAGPTLASSERARTLAMRHSLRPPVKRLDVAKLILARTPAVLVIVDGVFHDQLAVGHAEIRDALRLGWRVWGVSSMGAIRAREMAPLGMKGYGSVFERFVAEPDFQDDEVALLHEPTHPYRPVTEPLIHLRVAIDHLVARHVVGRSAARAVVSELKSRWYGDRTLRGTALALKECAKGGQDALRRELADFQRFAVKTLDLERFLEERPWA